jgi:hypothetical protein
MTLGLKCPLSGLPRSDGKITGCTEFLRAER